MPVHDWTRVTAGTFHAFHNSWITHIQESLNDGLLPEGYYALGEQRAGDIGPDVLALHSDVGDEVTASRDRRSDGPATDEGIVAVAEHPPQVHELLESYRDAAFYLSKRRTIVIYHSTGDRIVALIEILSPGNKHSRRTVDRFVEKAMAALEDGYHLLVVDLFPPGRYDPRGINSFIWEYIDDWVWELPAGHPCSMAAFCATSPWRAYIEPVKFGQPLIDMPLFLMPEHYINVPLESTYMAAYRGVPRRWRRVIEA